MYHLYYTTGSAAMSSHAVLEEIGAPYELHAIDFSQPRSAEFLRLNPNGTVPVLVDTDESDGTSLALYQSGAILLYLADKHPEAGLLPAVGTRERGLCYQWMFFMAERLMATYMKHFYPERQSETQAHQDAIQSLAAKQIADIWGQLDATLDPGPWFLGDQLSVCDFFIYTFSVWNQPSHKPLAEFQHLSRTIGELGARPSIQAMRQVQVDAA